MTAQGARTSWGVGLSGIFEETKRAVRRAGGQHVVVGGGKKEREKGAMGKIEGMQEKRKG